ncbi:MAG: ATP-binding protein [Sphingobacteriia bacterium]|nr:ATP-binding protein [Sphingobacteriia bacterium]
MDFINPIKLSYIDLGIISFYLIFTLILGMYTGRKIKGIRDYAVGGADFITPVLVATIVATWIGGGSTLSLAEKVFKYGFCYVAIYLCEVISMLLTSEFLVSKIYRFRGLISAGELMGELFGKPARIITGFGAALNSAGIVGVQIAAIGQLFQAFLGIDPFVGAMIGCGTVVIYSSFGGIKSVTYTDVIQFGFLIIAIPIVCNIGLSKVGGYTGLIKKLPPNHLKLFPNYFSDWKIIYYMLLFSIPFVRPTLIQRILMAKDVQHSIRSYRYTALLLIPFYFVVGTIGLTAFAINPEIKPALSLPYLIDYILPTGLKGIVMAGMFAIIMSTADSLLNITSISMVHDVVKPLLKRELSGKAELILAKIVTLTFGFSAIYVATLNISLIDLIFKFKNFWGPFVTFPLIFGIFGFKGSTRTFLIAGIIGFGTTFLWEQLNLEKVAKIDGLLPACLVNIILYVIGTTLDRKFNRVQQPQQIKNKTSKIIKFNSKFNEAKDFIKTLLPTPKNIMMFSSRRVEYFGAQYAVFGIFAVLNYIIPYFMWTPSADIEKFKIELTIRITSGLLCVLLIMRDYWPENLRKYLPMYWHFTLTFCLPFSTTYMFLNNNASTIWLVNLALTLFLLAVLVDWISFGILLAVGSVAGYKLFALTHDIKATLHISSDIKFITFYIALFSIMIGILFSRNREYIQQQVVLLLEDKIRERTLGLQKALSVKREFLNNLSHEIRTPIHGVTAFSEALYENWDKFTEDKKREIVSKIYNSTERLFGFVNNILDVSVMDSGKYELKPTFYDFNKLVSQIIDDFAGIAAKKNLTIIFHPTEILSFKFDKIRIQQVVSNLIDNAIKYTNKTDTEINVTIDKYIEKDKEYAQFTIKDQGIGIPQNEINEIFSPFFQSSLTKTGAGGTGLGLSICASIIEAHKGKIWAENYPGGTIFRFILPLTQ